MVALKKSSSLSLQSQVAVVRLGPQVPCDHFTIFLKVCSSECYYVIFSTGRDRLWLKKFRTCLHYIIVLEIHNKHDHVKGSKEVLY